MTLSVALDPVSLIRLITGGVMLASICKASVFAALTTPAALVDVTLTVPLAMSVLAVTLHLPSAATVVLRISPVPGMVTWMMSPSVPVPLIVGVRSWVNKYFQLPMVFQ